MPLNTHYTNRLSNAAKNLRETAPKKFYDIFNKFDFFDISDSNNSLSDDQKAQVAPQNQKRMSQFANAISEMIYWYNADDSTGILTNDVQEILDKLDIRSSTNKVKIDTLGDGLSAVPGGAAINAAQKAAGMLNASMMGSSDFAPDQIPPFAIGMPGMPSSIANAYAPGFLQPNWNFLYEQEIVKKTKFYTTDKGGFKIGCSIDVSQGDEIYLSKLFNVHSLEKNGNNLTPVGDPVGGLSQEQFEVIVSAHKKGEATSLGSDSVDTKISNFEITDAQMRSLYYKYIDLNFWKVIVNNKNWANGHWGGLTHNSCPEGVRTAISSFVWENGLAIEPNKSDTLALISYCLSIGMAYLVGFNYKVSITGIDGLDIDKDGAPIVGVQVVEGLPENKKVANKYFKFIADIIARHTVTASDEVALANRKRRIAEANQIYSYLSIPKLEFGGDLSALPFDHTVSGLKNDHFDKITSDEFTFLRYPNEGAPGGGYEIVGSSTPSSVEIAYDRGVNKESVSPLTIKLLQDIASEVGVSKLIITSTIRSPESQARVMFNNLSKGERVSYGRSGSAVVAVFDKYNSSKSDTEVKKLMTDEINRQGPTNVSRHCLDDPSENILDISHTRMIPQHKKNLFRDKLVEYKNTSSHPIYKFYGPGAQYGNDPAYHIQVKVNKIEEIERNKNATPPDIKFTVSDVNLNKETSWLAPLSQDVVLKEYEQTNSIES